MIRFVIGFILVITFTALFGYFTGHLGAYADHLAYSQPIEKASSVSWLSLPAAPGFHIAQYQAGHAWMDDEPWTYRQSIAIWNALFWSTLPLAAYFLYIVIKFSVSLILQMLHIQRDIS